MNDNDEKTETFEVLTPQGYEYSDKPQKMKFTKRTHCVRCGTCCRSNPPTLLKNDLTLLANGVIGGEHLMVIRDGEHIYSVTDKDIYVAPFEMIMVRRREGSSSCRFLSGENECEIYEYRPAQCRMYTCFGPQATITGLESARMVRTHLFGDIPFVMEAIARHDTKCSYRQLENLLEAVKEGDESAVDDVLDMLQYDMQVRPFLAEKLGLSSDVIALIFGQPLMETIREFGYCVEREGEDFILQIVKPPEGEETK